MRLGAYGDSTPSIQHAYIYIYTSMATSNILNHASKSFQKLLIAASPTNSICQAWRVRSLSVWLIHLQFQSKQTNNLTTYYLQMYIFLCTYKIVYRGRYGYFVTENVTKTFAVPAVKAPAATVATVLIFKVEPSR